MQVRNHRNPVARFRVLAEGGAWIEVPAPTTNYFVQSEPGMGPGPYQFRVTDSYGNVLIDSSIPHLENGTVSGAGQIPARTVAHTVSSIGLPSGSSTTLS
ncbi:MAG: hypothetical protein H6640_04535 [Caldilineaceae bacterium]|nr:hypothetical protein [Caldilineaceae bacterium]